MHTRACSTRLAVLALAVLPPAGLLSAQTLEGPFLESTAPARVLPGDSLRIAFGWDLPEEIGRMRIEVRLLHRDRVVDRVEMVRPSVAAGSGRGEALYVAGTLAELDRIQLRLEGRDGRVLSSELPVGLGSSGGGAAEVVANAELTRPGFDMPPENVGPIPIVPEGGRRFEILEPVARDSLVRLEPEALPSGALEFLLPREAFRDSAVVRALLQQQREGVASADVLRATTDRARMAEVLAERQEMARVGAQAVEPPTGDTLEVSQEAEGGWTIAPDGTMEQEQPDGSVNVIYPDGTRGWCRRPTPGAPLQCTRAAMIQVPRVVPGDEVATIDAAWLEGLDSWLALLADVTLEEMRTLVADDRSIQNYLALEEGETLYQRLDRRLKFLTRLVN